MSYKLKCECGQIIEGLTQEQTDFWMGQHIIGKRHKKNIKRQKLSKSD